MSNIRPITDMWILARSKIKYYGAYPSGFLQRARDLIGASLEDPVLHVCSGRVQDYPFSGFGPYDVTIDSSIDAEADYTQDVMKAWPRSDFNYALIDPPYTLEDAKKYNTNAKLPTAQAILHHALKYVWKVGILHYTIPRPPDTARFVAVVGVFCGFNNRMRAFSVFENR